MQRGAGLPCGCTPERQWQLRWRKSSHTAFRKCAGPHMTAHARMRRKHVAERLTEILTRKRGAAYGTEKER